jgi:hypothetical protein
LPITFFVTRVSAFLNSTEKIGGSSAGLTKAFFFLPGLLTSILSVKNVENLGRNVQVHVDNKEKKRPSS